MLLRFCAGLGGVDEGPEKTPRVVVRHTLSSIVTALYPIGVGELGRVLGRFFGEGCDVDFELTSMLLSAPSTDEAMLSLPETEEMVVYRRRGL